MDNYMHTELLNDFCFVVVSYNQENYVFQHLESIKFLIEKYGKNKKIQIIFSDDASSDKTSLFAELWLEKNKGLFNQQQVIKRKNTIGTIRNMIDAYKHINAKSYKLTGCDDLYFNNNVFTVNEQADIIFTPTIHFFDDKKIINEFNVDYLQMIEYQEKGTLCTQLQKKLAYSNCIEAPGVFMNVDIWRDKSLQDYLLQYRFIEDVPEWNYIFNVSNKNWKVKIDSKTYILYRHGVGVSTQIKVNDNPIDEEYRRIRKTIKAYYDILPKYINPYIYLHCVQMHIDKFRLLKQPAIVNTLEVWEMNIRNASRHIASIQRRAVQFQNQFITNDNKIIYNSTDN